MRKTIKIDGMTCAACAARIERVVGKLDGVSSASVNFAAETLTVDYDKTNLKGIEAAVIKAGYKFADGNAKKHMPHSRVMLIRLIISAAFALPLLYISMGHMLGAPLPEIINPHHNALGFALIQLCLTLPVMITGWKFYWDGYRNLVRLSPNMDSLIAISTTAAFLYGAYALYRIGFTPDGESFAMNLYFESVAVILTLITLGKFLEAISKNKTEGSVRHLMNLAPKTAVVVRNGKELEVKLEMINVGDTVVCRTGESIAADGTITMGTALVDESMLTGESIPVQKNVGDKVTGASVNKNGYFQFTAEKVGADTALSRIIRFVEEAQGSKAPVARLADKVSAYFVPTVLALAVIAALGWFIAGEEASFCLNVFISVLVIACPCALGLATPVAIMVGTGAAAEKGILIKGGEPLERICKVTTAVFDKTGTLTCGKPRVTDILPVGISENELLSNTAAAESASEHPLSEAIVSLASEKELALPARDSFESKAGYGISAEISGAKWTVGNLRYLEDNSVRLPEAYSERAGELASQGKTPVYAAADGSFKGIIAVADVIRSDSADAIKRLRDMKIRTEMLTGDNERTAAAVSEQLGLDGFSAGILPEGKAERIKKLQADGEIVAMAGDGINDAVALSQADIGVAVGQGTDVAIDCADVVLVRNSIDDFCEAIKISEATMRNIRQNLFWAFGYNILGIPVAMGLLHIFGGPLLNPMIAAAAMSLSSVSVISNALRLKSIVKKIGK